VVGIVSAAVAYKVCDGVTPATAFPGTNVRSPVAAKGFFLPVDGDVMFPVDRMAGAILAGV